ncbi:MAG: hypothetical protein CL587_20935 [Alteromonadaceae bacterium]|nr:hypothetical protein [Alteromonadaceae bacterium]
MDRRGAKKGENRFKTSSDTKVSNRIDKINQILSSLKLSQIAFETISALADHIVRTYNAMIDIEEKQLLTPLKKGEGKINRTTLLRKTGKYRHLLDSYQIALGSNSPSESDALSLAEKLELVNLREEVNALNKLIDSSINLEGQTSPFEPQTKENSATLQSHDANHIEALDACHKTIMLIIEATEGLLILENNGVSNVIKNGSERTVVDKKLFCKTKIEDSQIFKGFSNG